LYDGSFHEVDSSEMAFKIAGSMAFQDAAKKAKPVLLEPVMRVGQFSALPQARRLRRGSQSSSTCWVAPATT
jgi:hypothetical protein